AEEVRHPGPAGTADDMAGPQLVLLLLGAERGRPRARDQLQGRRPFEHHEDLLLGRVAVRRDRCHARTERPVVHPRLLSARLSREDPVALLVGLERVDVDDVLRPLARFAHLRLARRDLLLPRMPALTGLHPGPPEPRHTGPRQGRVSVIAAPAEDEHVEAVVSPPQRVRLFAGPVGDAVALANLVPLAVLPREPGAAEHVE